MTSPGRNLLAIRFGGPLLMAMVAIGMTLAGMPDAVAGPMIEKVTSPGGIEAWLVREPNVPLIALDFAFRGGANEDPADKAGLAQLVAETIDEGAGDLDSRAYHERLEERAIELSFSAGRDTFRGSLRALGDNRGVAMEMLRLALTVPRFDTDAVERVRNQVLASLRHDATNPTDIAAREWWANAYPDHPYGRPVNGTIDSVQRITPDDLRDYQHRVFARSTLKIAVAGDIDPATLGKMLDEVFGSLPATPELQTLKNANPTGLGRRTIADLDVPQAVIVFGSRGISRKDPDFMAAYLVNHILGGGSLSSRLYREVREKRGLCYGIYTSISWFDHTAVFTGTTATRADRASETLSLIDQELQRMAQTGPTEEELAQAKSFLKGSYGLNFDTSAKIAGQLVQIQLDDLGIDYIDRRNSLIDAVTLADASRVAKRLLDNKVLVTIAGRPQGVSPIDPGG